MERSNDRRCGDQACDRCSSEPPEEGGEPLPPAAINRTRSSEEPPGGLGRPQKLRTTAQMQKFISCQLTSQWLLT